MSRLILILALLILGIFVYRIIRQYKAQHSAPKRRIVTKNMVRCDYCGVHIPEHEALRSQGHTYCSDEHRLLDQSQD